MITYSINPFEEYLVKYFRKLKILEKQIMDNDVLIDQEMLMVSDELRKYASKRKPIARFCNQVIRIAEKHLLQQEITLSKIEAIQEPLAIDNGSKIILSEIRARRQIEAARLVTDEALEQIKNQPIPEKKKKGADKKKSANKRNK